MDFKALMTKLESIDKRQVLNESTTQPAKKTHKINLNENLDMKSSIARALMQEFGVNEEGPHPFDQQQYEPRGDVPAGPGMKDPAAALKHAWKYRTDQQGNLIGNRAKAELDNPDPSMSGDANIAGAANPAPAAQAAEPAGADQGAEAGAPPAQYDVDQSANIDSTSQAAPQAAQQPAAGSQADDAFQQANQEPAQDDPAQGGDAIGQAQAAQTGAVPTAQTQPAKQTTGSEMDTPAPAGITPAKPAAPQGGAQKPAAPAAGGWQAIYQMNKDVIGANPNLIKPGQQLKMPDGSTYTVKAGDSLSKIAASAKPKQDESLDLIRKLAGL